MYCLIRCVTNKPKLISSLNSLNMSTKCKVAVCQFTATNSKDNNLTIVKKLINNAVQQNATMIFLPEACDYIAIDKDESKAMSEPLNGPLITEYKNIAKDHKIWLSVGGFHERHDETTVYNCHILIDDDGTIRSMYRKIHLYDVSIPEKNVFLRESDQTTGGSQIEPPINTPAGFLALSIIVDPWGRILAECPKYTEGTDKDESIAVAEIDTELLLKIRQEMPLLQHRRNDIYSLNLIRKEIVEINDNNTYNFADKLIPGSHVFYLSKYSYAFTNIRCVVPGHVLISPLRVTPRLLDLSQEEVSDLFQTAVMVQRVMEQEHKVNSTCVCVQDGKFAGQTIPVSTERLFLLYLANIVGVKFKLDGVISFIKLG
ncbi:hypothetical protein NQ314_006075 [Rhamnusium bicolor]|uniref:bis(5'-adenosyl)-triphosphatase n=1 Tax=Rhamnusium bicolor TaxID=1586634 RepID=A0AAV8ZAJ8_9CUCU|nr:hypothetical protein NQ314_006075 [Rhamnusium bicolor]